MDLELNGKLALVTGSTAGIGAAIAKALAREGARVIINGRSQADVEKAVAAFRGESGGDVIGFAGDLGTAQPIEDLVRRHPEVDILVNNMGIFEPKPFEDIPDADWMRFFEVNVMSGVRLSRAYLPAMKRANWGRIIFISSESGVQIPAEMIHYGVTNDFVTALGGGDDFEAFETEFFQKIRPTSLLKRFETPEEIASFVAYLASPLASAITGAALRVDGGVVKSAF
jgi:NAD(P)-dependent dehydrogenase (short-subunit alcohol dehydrogenase family)